MFASVAKQHQECEEWTCRKNTWLTTFWLPKMKFETTTKLWDYIFDNKHIHRSQRHRMQMFAVLNCFHGNFEQTQQQQQQHKQNIRCDIPWETCSSLANIYWCSQLDKSVYIRLFWVDSRVDAVFKAISHSFMLIEHWSDICIYTRFDGVLSCFQRQVEIKSIFIDKML